MYVKFIIICEFVDGGSHSSYCNSSGIFDGTKVSIEGSSLEIELKTLSKGMKIINYIVDNSYRNLSHNRTNRHKT